MGWWWWWWAATFVLLHLLMWNKESAREENKRPLNYVSISKHLQSWLSFHGSLNTIFQEVWIALYRIFSIIVKGSVSYWWNGEWKENINNPIMTAIYNLRINYFRETPSKQSLLLGLFFGSPISPNWSPQKITFHSLGLLVSPETEIIILPFIISFLLVTYWDILVWTTF